MDAGGGLASLAAMFEHFVAAPARRRAASETFAILASLGDFPLPGIPGYPRAHLSREGAALEMRSPPRLSPGCTALSPSYLQ